MRKRYLRANTHPPYVIPCNSPLPPCTFLHTQCSVVIHFDKGQEALADNQQILFC